ncbi:MAG: hypothetical protein QG597_172 [Actinomycetota bacterium]|nr:hypothetical protein [Actinomycetota bacterium]
MTDTDESYFRHRFETRIAEEVFGHARPSDQPVTIVIGGQPGVGKTAGGNRVIDMYPPGEVVRIIGDDLRQFHPDFDHLMATDPLRMPDVTAPAMARWTTMCAEYANDHGYSVLVESTWRRLDETLDNVRQAASHDRSTHAVVVAVPFEVSRLSTLGRYYRAVDSGEPARWTPPEGHDNAAAQLPDAVLQIAGNPDVHRFTVTDRSGTILFDDSPSRPERGPEGLAAFDAAYRRPLTAQERTQVLQDVPYFVAAHTRHTQLESSAREMISWAEKVADQVRAIDRAETPAREVGTASLSPARSPSTRTAPPLSFPKTLRTGRSAGAASHASQQAAPRLPTRGSETTPER